MSKLKINKYSSLFILKKKKNGRIKEISCILLKSSEDTSLILL